MVQFTSSERHILSLFNPGSYFYFEGEEYVVDISGKPTTKQGEPKTDIYVKSFKTLGNEAIEFKISFKQENADFLENKMTAERAQQIFGDRWKEIICDFTTQIEEKFINRPYIFKRNFKRTKAGCITLGWKFELVNKPGGDLSDKVNLTPNEVLEVYAGRKLDDSKRNASVNGLIIPESGVANSVINCDAQSIYTIQEAVDNMIHIEKFAVQNPNVYFACKALNYRSFDNKYDGNRPLSVFIDWEVTDSKLNSYVRFDKPLVTKGNEVANKLIESLNSLGISNTDDIDETNVVSLNNIYF
ncbi:hypothetical protein SFC65_27050 [Priestia filamentosa]|uniref:hypothetical protein n=1 Tax=Priestia filamentosa TaxID=1402861 RepID=UPI003982A0B8